MMKSGSPLLLAKLRSPTRAAPLAWLAVFAVVLQLAAGAPLAARMMLDAAWGGTLDPDTALCAAHQDGDQNGSPRPAPGNGHHDHQHCALCQASAAPLLLAATVLLHAPAPARSAPVIPHPSAAPEERPALAYASRAPPLNA
jgi:hypothetical protein